LKRDDDFRLSEIDRLLNDLGTRLDATKVWVLLEEIKRSAEGM
jgi:hypothetical protein